MYSKKDLTYRRSQAKTLFAPIIVGEEGSIDDDSFPSPVKDSEGVEVPHTDKVEVFNGVLPTHYTGSDTIPGDLVVHTDCVSVNEEELPTIDLCDLIEGFCDVELDALFSRERGLEEVIDDIIKVGGSSVKFRELSVVSTNAVDLNFLEVTKHFYEEALKDWDSKSENLFVDYHFQFIDR